MGHWKDFSHAPRELSQLPSSPRGSSMSCRCRLSVQWRSRPSEVTIPRHGPSRTRLPKNSPQTDQFAHLPQRTSHEKTLKRHHLTHIASHASHGASLKWDTSLAASGHWPSTAKADNAPLVLKRCYHLSRACAINVLTEKLPSPRGNTMKYAPSTAFWLFPL